MLFLIVYLVGYELFTFAGYCAPRFENEKYLLREEQNCDHRLRIDIQSWCKSEKYEV